LIGLTIAIASWDVRTSTFIDRTWTVADAAGVEGAHAIVNVVTDAVGVRVSRTGTATLANGIKLVAIAVAVALWDVRTSAVVDRARTIADAASVKLANTWVNIVADAVRIRVGLTRTAALAKGVELVAVAVAVASWDARTPAVVNRTRTVADAAGVKLANTWVNIVADAVHVSVGLTRTATLAKGVKLVAVAVAIAFRDVRTSAVIDRAGTVADAASVKLANTPIDVVTNPVHVGVSLTRTAALAKGVELVAVAVAIAFDDWCTAARVNGSWTIANATDIQSTNTVVNIIANAVHIRISRTRATALA